MAGYTDVTNIIIGKILGQIFSHLEKTYKYAWVYQFPHVRISYLLKERKSFIINADITDRKNVHGTKACFFGVKCVKLVLLTFVNQFLLLKKYQKKT